MSVKTELRRELHQNIRSLDPAYREAADRQIVSNLLASDAYREASTIFVFVGTRNEVNTIPFIEQAFADGKRICVPRVVLKGEYSIYGDAEDPDAPIMEAREIRSLDHLEEGYQQLQEPNKTCPTVSPEEIDLVIAPCLSCDPYGNRIGYGGGFYDRFLRKIIKDTAGFAVCRKRSLSVLIPSKDSDVALPGYITEEGLFSAVSAPTAD